MKTYKTVLKPRIDLNLFLFVACFCIVFVASVRCMSGASIDYHVTRCSSSLAFRVTIIDLLIIKMTINRNELNKLMHPMNGSISRPCDLDVYKINLKFHVTNYMDRRVGKPKPDQLPSKRERN